jgi:transposase
MVFFFDESRFGLHPTIGRCWARKGVRVSAPVNPNYQNFYVYSGVSPLTGDAFSIFLPWVNTEMMNLYLAEMAAAFPDKEIMLIWDQAGWHKSNSLKVPDNIVLKSLPPYSPELNPVEKLWQWLKKHVCRNRLFDYLDDLMDTLAETLINLTATRFMELCQCSYLLQ